MSLGLNALTGMTAEDFDRIYVNQCEREGLVAAIRHPDTGEVFVGKNHREAYRNRREKLPDEGNTLADSRRAGSKVQYEQGFVDQDGDFMTRAQVEKRWGFRWSEAEIEVEI